ncbi:hypothetical protein INT47_004732 [Mucor saturninus]|uniref:Uncharacterized protein n=1 Tax=Mucor saturninus TaxID=64648 RepID=A0A8H7URT3_9FUNG|nr:hypothetical protein INT47_004732 [Mucor saturninus]
MLNKLTNPFHTHKKRRHTDRRSSLSTFIDFFRTEDPHPFANDALFEHNRYKQQKSLGNNQNLHTQHHPTRNNNNNKNHNNNHNNNNNNKNYNNNKPTSCILPSPSLPPPPALLSQAPTGRKETSILKKPLIGHRHTNSTPIQPTSSNNNNRKKTQQHIRHYSHVSCISSSNITVNSEDLTAKEFADIAGIRILSEDEECPRKHMEEKICTFCGQDDSERLPSLIVTSRISHSSMIRGSDHSSIYCPPDYTADREEEEEEEEGHQIWDNQFWRKPGGDTILMPPILHELKHHQDTFIKKGRFEIHLSSAINVLPPPTLQPVYEWKRKSRPIA